MFSLQLGPEFDSALVQVYILQFSICVFNLAVYSKVGDVIIALLNYRLKGKMCAWSKTKVSFC